jgi:repressor LexA
MEASLAWSLTEQSGLEYCDTCEIPLLGVVAAGQPYQAFAVEDSLDVPKALWGSRKVFALRVRGSSMIDEGIHDGDYIIVEPREAVDNGQTVVAEIDGGVTVKKLYREADGNIRLQPANPELLPLTVAGETVRVIGVVVGIMRKFGFHAGRRTPVALRSVKGSAGRAARKIGGRGGLGKRASAPDEASLELALNAIDGQIVRWNAAIERAQLDRRPRERIAQMAELGRDLQALRDWCARTPRASLRRALVQEANRVLRRMQRFATVTPIELPDLVLH